jgi:ABC-type multidrug transport system ATPase subunit/ABC-type antimicrobial peptide transport system permease subunit
MLTLNKCNKIYPNGNVGLNEFSLSLPHVGIILIQGVSGCGKTTFLNCLSGLDNFTQGEIFFNGNKKDSLLDISSFYFQERRLFENKSINDNLSLTTTASKQEIKEILSELGILDHLNDLVKNLSGGQRARVEIARVLLQKEEIIFFDEPFASLDEENIQLICKVINKYQDKKLIFLTSHQDINKYIKFTQIINIDQNHQVTTAKLEIIPIQKEPIREKKKLSFHQMLLLTKDLLALNKLKTISTFILLFFSVLLLCICSSFLNIDKVEFTYDTYKVNNIESVSFLQNDPDSSLPMGVPANIIDDLSCDYVCYEGMSSYVFQYDNQFVYFTKVYLDKNADDEFIIHHMNEYPYLSDYQGEKYYPTSYVQDETSYLIISQNYYEKINVNMYMNYQVTITENDKYISPNLYNENCTYLKYENTKIKEYNKMPENNDEIIITEEICSFLNIDENSIIGKEIELEFCTRSLVSKNYTQTEKIKFTIVGISEETLYVNNYMRDYLLSNYGNKSLNNSMKTVIYTSYNLDTFIKANKYGLISQDEITPVIDNTISTINFFKPLIIALCGIVVIITLVSFLNSIKSSIFKYQKEIGILLIFNIEKKYITIPFILETLIISLIAGIFSLPLYQLFLNTFNNIIIKVYNAKIYPLKFNYISLLIIGLTLTILIVVSTLFSLKKLSKMKKIELLKK